MRRATRVGPRLVAALVAVSTMGADVRAIEGQAPPPSPPPTPAVVAPARADSAALRARLWVGIRDLQQLEVQTGALLSASSTDAGTMERARPLFERQEAARLDVEQLLEEVVFGTPWGPGELIELRRAFPASLLLVEYDARRAVRDDRLVDARRLYDRLLAVAPRSAALQRSMAEVQEREGDADAARLSHVRVLELEPGDEAAFRKLVRLHEADGSLEALLERVRRLELRFPDSITLAQHEIELLHRLGRTAEAEAAAAALKERGRP